MEEESRRRQGLDVGVAKFPVLGGFKRVSSAPGVAAVEIHAAPPKL